MEQGSSTACQQIKGGLIQGDDGFGASTLQTCGFEKGILYVRYERTMKNPIADGRYNIYGTVRAARRGPASFARLLESKNILYCME
jgi:hypothetical protein